MQFVHGGDWAGYRAEFGRDPLDFSANVSPLGLPRRTATPTLFAAPCGKSWPHTRAFRRNSSSAATARQT